MKKLKIKHFWRYCLWASLVLVLLGAGGAAYFYGAINPQHRARQAAIQTAKQYVSFDSISKVDSYRGREVFYTVFGRDKQGQAVMVTINPKQDGQVYVYQPNQGISRQQARATAKAKGAKKIQQVTFGMAKGGPVWEVRSQSTYYLIDFETGDLVEKEGL